MSSKLAICSIISRNRLAYARTLIESIRKVHPTTPCHVLLIDDSNGYIDAAQEEFEVLALEALGIPQLNAFRFKYTAFELCCALKPYLMDHLLQNEEVETVLYFDTDILVLSPLGELLLQFQSADILLTPHLLEDFPDDGKKPDDGHVLLSGVFNGGFVGIRKSKQASEFLQWWKSRLYDACIEDHFNGHFVDQKYLDLSIGLFDRLGIVRHPGCNVAYWNLHSKSVQREENNWRVNQQALLFFHFSDYNPEQVEQMSGHQNRFNLREMKDLYVLFEWYRARLLANGYEASIKWSYEFGCYRNGKKISKGARRAFLFGAWPDAEADPFDSSQHAVTFRMKAYYQSFRLFVNRLALKLLRKPTSKVRAIQLVKH